MVSQTAATTRAKNLQAALAAQNLFEQAVLRGVDRLHTLNSRLIELQEQIRAIQPVASGSICLELYPCGPGCSGCPHARWVRYYFKNKSPGVRGTLISQNLSSDKKDPAVFVPKSAPYREDLLTMIREAKGLLDARAKLLSAGRTVSLVGSYG